MFQYFVKVVPTVYKKLSGKVSQHPNAIDLYVKWVFARPLIPTSILQPNIRKQSASQGQ